MNRFHLHYFNGTLPRTREKLLEMARHQVKEITKRSTRTDDASLMANELRLLATEIEKLAAEVAN